MPDCPRPTGRICAGAGFEERDRWLPALAWGLGIAVVASAILALLAATIRRGARREDEVHRAMIDATNGLFLFHGVAESGAHLRLTRASASIAEVCGFTLREAQADPSLLLTIAVDDDRAGLANALVQTIASGKALRHRFRMRHARLRSTRHVLLIASRLPGRHENEYAGACIDITSETEAEQALRDAQRRLEVSRRSRASACSPEASHTTSTTCSGRSAAMPSWPWPGCPRTITQRIASAGSLKEQVPTAPPAWSARSSPTPAAGPSSCVRWIFAEELRVLRSSWPGASRPGQRWN